MNSGREILEFLKMGKKKTRKGWVGEMKGEGLAEGGNVPREKRK